MHPVARKSISEQVAEVLRREILSGSRQPGSRLPAEAELAQRFGTNRNTLREAIRSLEGMNLIHVRQGDGVFVRDFRKVGELSLLPHYLLDAPPLEQPAALEELLDLRRFVLGEAAALAARRATAEEIAELRGRLSSVAAALERPRSELIAADLEFFRALALASHSAVYLWIFNTFARVYASVIPLVERLWVMPARYLEQLTAVSDAVAAHAEERARKSMVEHFAVADRVTTGRER